MSLWNYGPTHRWFAWHPVVTDCGWRWLRILNRRRVYLGASMPAATEWWDYELPVPSVSVGSHTPRGDDEGRSE